MNSPDRPRSYAWLPPHHLFIEPVRAVLVDSLDGSLWDTVEEFHSQHSFVQDLPTYTALLHHPDLGEIPSRVSKVDLRGFWDERPQADLLRSNGVPAGWNPEKTWDELAEDRYRWVCEQRDLADRLTALGISRARRHYAGKGGTSIQAAQVDTALSLNHEDLLRLVQLAERGNT